MITLFFHRSRSANSSAMLDAVVFNTVPALVGGVLK